MHGRKGLIFDLSFNIQYHTIGLKWLSSDIHGYIGRIFDVSRVPPPTKKHAHRPRTAEHRRQANGDTL